MSLKHRKTVLFQQFSNNDQRISTLINFLDRTAFPFTKIVRKNGFNSNKPVEQNKR